MTLSRPTLLGGAVGALAALLALASHSMHPAHRPMAGPMLGEHGGTIRSVVMQYTRGSSFVWPVYRQFLEQQSPDLIVYVVCPAPADWAELRDALGSPRCTIKPIFTGHPVTPWSRDRWVELLPTGAGEPITLLAQQGELQQAIWPQREGDSHVAEDLANALKPAIEAHRSSLFFDGGDLLCDGRFVFVTPAVLQRNLQHTVTTRQELMQVLEHDLRRQPVVMDDAPDHHAGMYMMAAGDGRMIVADPSLGRPLLNPAAADFGGEPDFSAETQKHFDSVAAIAAQNGYRVYRIPVVPARNGKTFLTYVNVIMDVRDGRPVVYMPMYDGQPQLNAAAQKVWESLGYTVHPINCTTTWQRGGTLHCLVNVLERTGE